MSDSLDDAIHMRLAGYYEAGHDDPDETPHPHAAQPGHMRTVADLVAELEQVRGLLRELVGWIPASAQDMECYHCDADLFAGVDADTWLSGDLNLHAADCPWRLAAEYVARIEARNE